MPESTGLAALGVTTVYRGQTLLGEGGGRLRRKLRLPLAGHETSAHIHHSPALCPWLDYFPSASHTPREDCKPELLLPAREVPILDSKIRTSGYERQCTIQCERKPQARNDVGAGEGDEDSHSGCSFTRTDPAPPDASHAGFPRRAIL